MAGESGPRIKAAREAFRGVGMDQKALAARLGVSSSRLSNWENGKHEPPQSFLDLAAAALEVAPRWLSTGEGSRTEAKLTPTFPAGLSAVKVYGTVSAGNGNARPFDEDEVYVPNELARSDYGALIVDGDSMNPLLFNSDVAVFKDSREGRVGQIVAACMEDGSEWVVKQLQRGGDGRLVLASLNQGYGDIAPPFEIHGYLVGYYRVEGPERTIRYNPYGLKAR
ncbi:helix-turn-helix transcriptional regulator [bacterium]|nr:MAG: helix-turn-helix transcriptional regulator [bacterium]